MTYHSRVRNDKSNSLRCTACFASGVPEPRSLKHDGPNPGFRGRARDRLSSSVACASLLLCFWWRRASRRTWPPIGYIVQATHAGRPVGNFYPSPRLAMPPRTLSPAHNKDSKTEETATRNPGKNRKDGPETESEEERSQYVLVSPEDALRNTTDLGAFQGIRI